MRRPNFFIVGAPRSGTTAMYEYLRQHPEVFMPYRKEPGYFGSDLTKGPPYLTEQSYLALFAGAKNEKRLGEATVWYLYSETAPREIREFAPDARIIIMLRDPVEMIHSLHAHFLYTDDEEIAGFAEALAAEEDRRAGRRLPPHARRPEGLQYRRCGRYAPFVRRYLDVFGRENVSVIIFDDFRTDTAAVYRETLEFLDVQPGFRPAFEVVNPSKRSRSLRLQRAIHSPSFTRAIARLPDPAHHRVWRLLKRLNMRPEERPTLDPELRRRLRAEFAPSVEELAGLLGRDLSAWTRG